MTTQEIIVYCITGFMLLFSISFIAVIIEDELDWKRLEKKWKKEAEERKGQYIDGNRYIDQKQEPKKNLTIKTIPQNFAEIKVVESQKIESKLYENAR